MPKLEQKAVSVILSSMAKDPNAVALGRKGGKKQVPKGFATMDPEERRRIQIAGGQASAAKRARAKRKAKN